MCVRVRGCVRACMQGDNDHKIECTRCGQKFKRERRQSCSLCLLEALMRCLSAREHFGLKIERL